MVRKRKGLTSYDIIVIRTFLERKLQMFTNAVQTSRAMLKAHPCAAYVNHLAYYQNAESAVRKLLADVNAAKPTDGGINGGPDSTGECVDSGERIG